jgi:uncharacterized protein (DUF983 family)
MAGASPAPLDQAIRGLCPRCGAPTLFAGPVRFAERCRSCALDFTTFNVGDGPAAFLTLGVGAVVVVLALLVDAVFEPPLWLHALLWMPLTIALIVGGLRVAKAWLIAAEYRNQAREARLERSEP